MEAIVDAALIGVIDGLDFNTFFRGLLSTLTMFLVLCGSTYFIVATDTGFRQGLLLCAAALFGWNFLMGIFWTGYGAGWIGGAPTWELVEIVEGDMSSSERDSVRALQSIDIGASVTSMDPDEAQAQATKIADETDLSGWRFLLASDSVRGDAMASVDAYLIDRQVFDSTSDYLPLAYNAFITGGKPQLKSEATIDRVGQFFSTTFKNPIHKEELIAIGVQKTADVYTLSGDSPPVPTVDEQAQQVTVVMSRDRGGPIGPLISGMRFTPLAFTLFNGLIFAALALLLHNKDLRIRQASNG